jgi:ComF family protein
MELVNNWLNIIQEHLLPPTCILCGNPGLSGLDMCATCYQLLPRNNPCCARWAEILPAPIASPTLCGRCLSNNPAFDQVTAPFIYQEEIQFLIAGLKFGKQFKNARLLGLLLSEHLQIISEKPDCIIPVPLHAARYRERGFNQAAEIAKTVSERLSIPANYGSCIRHKNTPHQTGLPAKVRRKNVSSAFSVQKPLHARHVALLDDVMTTGSTVQALASNLKKSGVSQVDVWVCARA